MLTAGIFTMFNSSASFVDGATCVWWGAGT